LKHSLVFILIGTGLVTIIDILGSIASRRFNFNYAYLIIASLIAYTFTGYSVSEKTNSFTTALLSVILVGIFDATAGWAISQKLKANYGQWKEQSEKLTLEQRLFSCIIFSVFCTVLGHYLAGQSLW
jgi:hypothetical protein